jgi:O-antigen/teichoic acid export membrane protein
VAFSYLARAVAFARSPVAIYVGASVLARVGGIVLIPLYTRRLTPAEYGDYALAQTLVLIFPALFTFGLLSAIPRVFYDGDVAASGPRTASVASWLAVLAIGSGLLAEAAVLALASPGEHLFGRWELTCILAAGVGMALAGVPHVYLRASQRTLTAAMFQLLQFVLSAGSGLALVAAAGRGLRGSIEALAVSSGIAGVVSLAFIVLRMRGALDRAVLREALRFSIPFVPHIVASWFQGVTDRWTMKGIGLDRELGGYSLAAQLVSPVPLVVNAYADADNPRQGEIFRASGLAGIDAILNRTRRAYLLATILPAGLIVAAVPVLSLLVGKDFVPALRLLPFLLVSSLFDALQYPSANVVYYASSTRYVPIATVSSGVVNVGLNILLIPHLGVYGAIIARAVAAAVRMTIMTLAAHSCLRSVRAKMAAPDG